MLFCHTRARALASLSRSAREELVSACLGECDAKCGTVIWKGWYPQHYIAVGKARATPDKRETVTELHSLELVSPPSGTLPLGTAHARLAGTSLHSLPVDAAPGTDSLCITAAQHPRKRLQRRAGDADALDDELTEGRLGLGPLLGLRVAVGVEEGRQAEVVVGKTVFTKACHELLDAAVLATSNMRLGSRVVRERVRQDASQLHLLQPLARTVAVAGLGACGDHRVESDRVRLHARLQHTDQPSLRLSHIPDLRACVDHGREADGVALDPGRVHPLEPPLRACRVSCLGKGADDSAVALHVGLDACIDHLGQPLLCAARVPHLG